MLFRSSACWRRRRTCAKARPRFWRSAGRRSAAPEPRRVPHPTDRRTTLAEITDAGRGVVEEATQAVTEAAFAMDGLSERELEQLIRLLRKLRFSAGDFEG